MDGHQDLEIHRNSNTFQKKMIDIAMIGCGRIAALLEEDPFRYKPCTHLGSILKLNSLSSKNIFRIIGLCDLDVSKCERINLIHKTRAKIDSDYKKILRKNTCDLVIIATHTDSHIEIALEAIKNNVKAIVLEKPAGLNTKDIQKLHKAGLKSATAIWVNFERRYHPVYRYIKECIKNREYGEIRAIRGRVHTWTRITKNMQTGTLLHDGIHLLDLLLWYVGKPEKTRSEMEISKINPKIEIRSSLTFNYPGFQAHIQTDSMRKYYEFIIEIDFEQGKIIASNDGHVFFKSAKSKLYEGFLGLEEFQPNIQNYNPWLELYKEVQQFFCQPKNTIPSTNLSDSIENMKIISRCFKNSDR